MRVALAPLRQSPGKRRAAPIFLPHPENPTRALPPLVFGNRIRAHPRGELIRGWIIGDPAYTLQDYVCFGIGLVYQTDAPAPGETAIGLTPDRRWITGHYHSFYQISETCSRKPQAVQPTTLFRLPPLPW